MANSMFGKELKKKMIENDENLMHVAEYLGGVSVPFVSAVIAGKKNVPEDWIEKISTHYKLDLQEQNYMRDLAEQSKQTIKISLTNCSNQQRGLALQLQRNLNNLDDNEIQKLMDILKEKK